MEIISLVDDETVSLLPGAPFSSGATGLSPGASGVVALARAARGDLVAASPLNVGGSLHLSGMQGTPPVGLLIPRTRRRRLHLSPAGLFNAHAYTLTMLFVSNSLRLTMAIV